MGPLVGHDKSGKKYKILFENAPLGIFVVDTNGKILDVNSACLEILGSPGQEATKAINVLTFPPLIEAGVSAALTRCMSDGTLVRHNTPYTSAWGKTSHLKIVLAPLLTDKGEVEGCQAIVEDITKQKCAEATLRESEKVFQRILSGSPVAISMAEDRVMKWVNEAWVRMFGFEKEEEYLGKNASHLYYSLEEYARAGEALYSGLEIGEIRCTEAKFVRKDGSIFDVQIRMQRLDTPGPEKVTIAAITDISERKRANEALAESHQKLTSILESISDAFFSLDANMVVTYFNQAAEKFLGRSKEEVLGRPLFDSFPEARGSIFEEQYSLALREKIPVSFETRFEVPPYSNWYCVRAFPQPHGISVYFHVVTERNRQEEALRESEARFRFLAEAMVDVVWTMDLNLQTTYVSPSIVSILGFTQEERKQQRIEDQVTPESLLAIRELLAAELQKELEGMVDPDRNITILAEHYKKDGGTLWLESTVRAIRDDHGVLIGIHGLSRDITERKKAEEKLRESEERFRLLADNMTDVIWEMSPDFVLTYVNPSVKTVWGGEPSEVLGKPIWDFVTPASFEQVHDRVLDRLEKLISSRGSLVPALYETEQIRKDGTTVWTETMAVPLFDDDGKLLRFQGITRDITERKKAEEAIKLTRRRLENSQRIGQIGTWEWNAVTGETYWSDEVYRIFGFEPQSEVPSYELVKDNTHPADVDRWEETVKQSLSSQKRFQLDHRILRKDGEIIWMHSQGDIIRDKDGKPTGFLGTVQDITDRKIMEESLKESERMKSLVLENTREIFTCFDIDLRILWANKAASEALGFGPEYLAGKHCYELWHCRTDPCEECPVRLAMETGVPQYVDDRTTPDGKHWSVRAYPVFDAEGNVVGATQLVADITTRKNLEAQLLQSQKNEAIGTLAAGIAHDFNNMLQVILGTADLLLWDKKKGEPGYDELKRIIKTSEDARDLVQKIRLVSKRADIQPRPLDLNSCVNQATHLLLPSLSKNIQINVRLAQDLRIIHADPAVIDQMLMNLAINASEAMPDGGTLTIKTENIVLDEELRNSNIGLQSGNCVLLTVSDTGRGIEKDRLHRIFDPFYSTKMRDYHKGTGLGLPIVRGVVELHKGSILVESEVGKGTTFKIYFPTSETAHEIEKPEKPLLPPTGNETILLVEDEDIVRELAVKILEKHGYKTITAGDGQEALEVYGRERNNISLVLMDIIMPRMDGKQCLVELLRINPEVRILLSTGVVQDELIQDLLFLGAKGAVRKPFSVQSLLQQVREVLDAR